MFYRKIYFDTVRPMFGGNFDQGQVDGQNFILDAWEKNPLGDDLRWLAYPLATTKHETASTMLPIEEYGKGSGHDYGKPDPVTGQTYYGRGFIQLTHRGNYASATDKLDLDTENDLEWHAARALDPTIAANVMFFGMAEGWFRGDSKGRHTLERWFNDAVDDAYMAREIINGDKHIVPDWSGGVSIGKLIADYHKTFLTALQLAYTASAKLKVVTITIDAPPGVEVRIIQT